MNWIIIISISLLCMKYITYSWLDHASWPLFILSPKKAFRLPIQNSISKEMHDSYFLRLFKSCYASRIVDFYEIVYASVSFFISSTWFRKRLLIGCKWVMRPLHFEYYNGFKSVRSSPAHRVCVSIELINTGSLLCLMKFAFWNINAVAFPILQYCMKNYIDSLLMRSINRSTW